MSDETFQREVLQRLTAVETELKLMRRNGWGKLAGSGGTGGGVAVALIVIARMMGLL
ncbi:hypothetical protein LCGC14_0757580 [marine sediment metagenome]|uniref:Uncharacterized protein n=1 Tax=marine sediment metagenome TaxID=412755 RepID=A0A0F9SMF9_9ZZZZ